MVGVPLRVRVGIQRGLGEGVFAVHHRRLGEIAQSVVPFFLARQVETRAPVLRGLQSPTPVGQLKRQVERLVLRKNFLCALQHRAENEAARVRVPSRVARHEVGGLKNDVAEFFERGLVLMLPPAQLRVENRMRLLPHEKRPDGRRRFRAARTGHLGPTRTGVALTFSRADRARQNLLVVVQRFFQHRQTIPQRELRLMPPVHFEVELSFPRVVSQPGFLRRIFADVLNGEQVLRKHDAAFQFKPARVFAAGQVNRAAGLPELVPAFLRGSFCFGKRWKIFYREFFFGEGAGEFQFRRSASRRRSETNFKLMPRLQRHHRTLRPTGSHAVFIVVQLAEKLRARRPRLH